MSQKQRLLDKDKFQKELKQKQQKAAIERQQAIIKQKMAQLQENSQDQADPALTVTKPKSNARIYGLIFILLILALVPYPKVIVYEKLGVVAQSIYIPSRFGSPDFILDSHYQINLDPHQRWLYLCDNQNLKQCTRYDIIEVQGFFSAVQFFFTGRH